MLGVVPAGDKTIAFLSTTGTLGAAHLWLASPPEAPGKPWHDCCV